MENTDNITRFKWSRTYLLQLKGKGTWFFNPKERTENIATFEYRITAGGKIQTLHAFVFVPTGHDYEVAGPIEWQGRKVFLEANRSIPRSFTTKRNEKGEILAIVGDKIVKYEDHRKAFEEKDEEFYKI